MRYIFLLLALICFVTPTFAQEECNPIITGVRFDGERDLDISRRILELYREDQAARQPNEAIDWERLIQEDRARREEILVYLQAGQVIASEDLHRTALIFQHGDCSAHYALAADLALRAFEAGYQDAGWLYAAATDRYLQSMGSLQRYGTQYMVGLDGRFMLCPVNGEISDEERAVYGLPSLESLQARAEEWEGIFTIEPHRFAILSQIPYSGVWINRFVLLVNCLA